MKLAILGAGAVGGALGARLQLAGHDVTFAMRSPVARLRIEAPDQTITVDVRAVETIETADAVLVAVKTQDVDAALDRVRADLPIACLTNGLAAERIAAARFSDVHAVNVLAPAEHLEPGLVRQWTVSPRGVLDIGRFPDGVTALDESLASAFRDAGYVAEARADILAWKRAKLLLNLGNVVEAFALDPALGDAARDEAVRVFAAAGLAVADDRARKALVTSESIGETKRRGGSTWQSVQRGQPVETAYLNGEIVRLGTESGIATPINERLTAVARARGR